MSKVTVLSEHRRGSHRLETGEVIQALRELSGVAHVNLIAQRVLSRHPNLMHEQPVPAARRLLR